MVQESAVLLQRLAVKSIPFDSLNHVSLNAISTPTRLSFAQLQKFCLGGGAVKMSHIYYHVDGKDLSGHGTQ
jgi:hypothetical protein